MSWVTVIWAMTASACLTLGFIHLVIWSRQRAAWANLLFALVALGTAAFTGFEMALMRAETPAAFALVLRWIHVPGWLVILSIAGFVRLYLKAGRNWLLWSICIIRTISLLLNFLLGQNLNYWEITRLRHIQFLGETVAIAEGVSNHWMLVGQTAYLLLLIFVVDATLTVWRRGDRRRALIIGGGVIFFVLGATGETTLVLWQLVEWPFIASLPALATISAMAYELTLDAQRAGQLSRDLRESEQRMALATDAANLGIWIRDLVRNEIWATDKWRTLFGFAKSERIDLHAFLQRLHPEDRDVVSRTMAKAVESDGHYETEYRVVRPEGETRWIASLGRVEFNGAKQPVLVRGTSLDITDRKRAEAEAQQLSGQLIHAQEAERMRLARELHDDFSQRLALLAVELDLLGQQPSTSQVVTERMQEFSEQVRNLSADVHRLSHELHPAKLEQLGLEAAVRGFAKELGAAHQLAIECEFHGVPRGLPDELALCCYRIVQEGLQNVVKHSDALGAKVALRVEGNDLCLVISDPGTGFDPAAASGHSSLGLVSMRERVRLGHGKITIQSRLGEGTTIDVRVPLPKPAPDRPVN